MHKISVEGNNTLRIDVSGHLDQSDYDQIIPACEQMIARHGTMRLLFVMEDFHGWTPGAAWDDLKFGLKHGAQVPRVAMVGETKWQEWLSKLGALFPPSEVRYFDKPDLAKAKEWVGQPLPKEKS